ncbi:MAG: NAD(P)-dependent oxidoreductase [Rhodospirillales bacterium]|jgi:3-hydroxyisobutyrate dehydrogenase|nr:NAD(P)-dependent oxidoreductase [Rhodospirillales bacterium]MBT4006043.1 NAD(P)-dependent oxidoreductase [Rhodospirillales bacterium]MBT5112786.1 NAD(P)-dependent oxidoreductase [Rhodospirillales bacterium]MBT5673556.1 NAD(P)-dependent oxidoreductase [Rhodospirillales bacterium]MBT6186215.1 NAD(P)-dependent oxidoreductase [Rhodospirillales bacterium]
MATQNFKLSFIGLGVMGGPMAGHLAKAGYDVTVYNRTASKAKAWVDEYGGSSAETPEEAGQGADIVFACVGNDDDLRDVTLGPSGAFGGLKPGAIFVDHTTASAHVARELEKAASVAGFGFLDAPVSGGEAGAINGTLTIMTGGDGAVFETAKPVMETYAQAVTLMGPAGSGQLTKMVNQICVAGVVQGLAEGLNFGARAGLDMDRVIDVISKGAASSWQMENRAKTMVQGEFDFGFAVDWMRKDLAICREEAKGNGAVLTTTEMIDGFYAEVQKMGGARWDTSSLIARLNKE